MSTIKIILFVFLGLIILVVGYLGYLGMFSKPVAAEQKIGPYTFVYEEFIGPYKDSGSVFEKVYNVLKENGIESTKGIGVYFDDPAKVEAEKLRSHCGAIIEEKDYNKLAQLEGLLKKGNLAQKDSIVVEFPKKGILSYMIGPMKCYPILAKYAKEKGYNISDKGIEIYDEPAKKIYFIFQIENWLTRESRCS